MKKHGFINIDALDPSQGSLDQSKTLDAYTNYICDTLDEHRTQIQDGQLNFKRFVLISLMLKAVDIID